jgi:hypothetical protein
MKKAFEKLGALAQRYPALLVGLLAGGTLVSGIENSLVTALIQGACALSIACTVKRWY